MKLQPHEWLLAGLDGGNPLAFLAALGAHRTASIIWPDSKATSLRWMIADNAWRPVLTIAGITEKQNLLEEIYQQLRKMITQPAFSIGDDLNLTGEKYRAIAVRAQKSHKEDPIESEFLASFANEIIVEKKKNQIENTAFRTMQGAGHQHFLKTMRALIEKTSIEQIESCLFRPWQYKDIGLSLRFDPEDDRRHALRWKEPSKDVSKTEHGANRLAIEALPLFPVQPIHDRLETTAFSTFGKSGIFFTWPIWVGALSINVIQSLLTLSSLQQERPERQALQHIGIVEVYRSQRITTDKYRNFTTFLPVTITK